MIDVPRAPVGLRVVRELVGAVERPKNSGGSLLSEAVREAIGCPSRLVEIERAACRRLRAVQTRAACVPVPSRKRVRSHAAPRGGSRWSSSTMAGGRVDGARCNPIPGGQGG